MTHEEEPLEERLRRALRIEQVVSEVSSLKSELQRIGSRLVTLRAELVALGADPSVISQGELATPGQPGSGFSSVGAGARPSSATMRAVEINDADVGPEPAARQVDLVPFDAIWDANEH